ncbi:MAG TPA: AAA family ATPase [Roseiarcus sp.]|jgi:pilus assembly protein CpaE|nr:AAA family ATPase [Roseiarcus sp.]
MAIYLTQEGGDEAKVDEIEGKLKSTIPDLKRVPSLEAIDPKSVKGADRSIVLLVASTPKHANVENLIDVVSRNPRNLFFIVVGGDISARDYKRLLQCGNADWVAEGGLPQEILDIVGRVSAPARDDGAVESPVVVSFTPSAGGVGNSTLAIETAIHLVKDKSNKSSMVALVDLDFQSSHVCDYLDIVPKFQFEEIVAAPDRLDDHLLCAFISHHPSGLDVLAAGRSRFHARDLSVEALSALFDRMAQRYSTIIIDLPLSVHSWTLPLLAASKGILVTGLNTIPGLRQIEETLRALREEASITAQMRLVINRCDFSFFGKVARADHVARILGKETRFCVRNAAVAVECVNVGTPITLAYPSDKSVKDIAAISAFCAGLHAASRRSIG